MADEPEPKQTTEKGYEIPVPKRGEFFRDLRKVAPPVKAPKQGDESKDA